MEILNKNKFLIDLSESDHTSFGKIEFDLQKPAQKVFSSIWELEGQVTNGGFSGYFMAEKVAAIQFVAQALREINAPKTAAICDKAIALAFPHGMPISEELKASHLAAIADQVASELDGISDEFIQYPHDLTELLFNFVKRNGKEFGQPSGL
ncbi:MAG TPA: DUF4375 domain-containing protein [Aestuariivirga sp.]